MQVTDVAFRPLFTIEFETAAQIVGNVPMGYFRRSSIITAGRFSGDRLSGRALAGGGDWLTKRADGVIHLDVRAMLETDAGEGIYMTYTGRLKMPPDAEERLARGESLSGEQLYFRTAVAFETAAPRLIWLNDILAIGIGSRRPQGPRYEVLELL
jgi:hypothetical protein